jgi:acyl-coenzyme A synthetase/AMP-(fatty) acid ligase
LTEEEALFILADSESALLIASDSLALSAKLPQGCRRIDEKDLQTLKRSSIEALPPTKRDDPALLVYTSGTTSRPKGVLHAHRMIWGRRLIQKYFLGVKHGDVVLHTDTLNFTYTYGLLLMDPWSVGATALLYAGAKNPPPWLRLIRNHQATIFATTPSTYVKILEAYPETDFRLPTLRHSVSGGDVITDKTIDEWEKRTGVPLYNGLGMSEINLPITNGPLFPRKRGSVGKALDPKRVAVLEREGPPVPVPVGKPGLLAIHRSDPRMMLGYWHRPEEEKACFRGEWFLTGDLVVQDEEGYFFYIGRVGNILNIDADVVSPSEVEAAFDQYPGIQEIGCWAVPGPDQTLILSLFVVPQKGHSLQPEELFEHAKAHLADYKRPKRIYFVEKLPRDTRGKLLRRKLPDLIDRENRRSQ